MYEKKNEKYITVALDGQRWRGVEFEARLLSQVFGQPFTPERVVQAMVEKAFQSRSARVV